MTIERPPNIKTKQTKQGTLYGWQPGSRDMKKAKADPKAPSFLKYHALGYDMLAAFGMAEGYNERLVDWRKGRQVGLVKGSVGWLMNEFLKHREVERLSKSSRDAYQRQARYITGLMLKGGKKFSDKQLVEIRAKTAFNMHNKLIAEHGLNTGNRCVKAIRYAWDLLHVIHEDYIPAQNPYAKLKMAHEDSRETPHATYDELVSIVSAAIAMGETGMAFGIRLIWDFHIRADEVFCTSLFDHWRPADQPSMLRVGSDKNNNALWQPLDDPMTDETMFPELEALYRMLPYSGGALCQRELRRGRRVYDGEWQGIKYNNANKIFNRIRAKAGVSANISLSSIRHGGLTELGNANVSRDLIKSRSNHKQASTLDRYVHSNVDQAAEAQRMRLKLRGK